MTSRKRVGVLISGRGSNMQSLVNTAADADYPAEICLVLSNRPEAAGLTYAKSKGIPTAVIDHRKFADRQSFDSQINDQLKQHSVDIVACAGFMRIMTEQLIENWVGRILNIHPSLLPNYRGLSTHERALADGVKIHGCSVHFITPELDAGPIIAQAAVPVSPDDTASSLADRVLKAEHAIYPKALAWVASGEVKLENGKVNCPPSADNDQVLFSPRL